MEQKCIKNLTPCFLSQLLPHFVSLAEEFVYPTKRLPFNISSNWKTWTWSKNCVHPPHLLYYHLNSTKICISLSLCISFGLDPKNLKHISTCTTQISYPLPLCSPSCPLKSSPWGLEGPLQHRMLHVV